MVAKRSANELSEARGVGGTIIYQGRGPLLTVPDLAAIHDRPRRPPSSGSQTPAAATRGCRTSRALTTAPAGLPPRAAGRVSNMPPFRSTLRWRDTPMQEKVTSAVHVNAEGPRNSICTRWCSTSLGGAVWQCIAVGSPQSDRIVEPV
jgi:hypothetical protein